ncbi:MAG: LysM peptidoglycan-binding domain-containing protein [Candidatus Woesearchaeota archaeon]
MIIADEISAFVSQSITTLAKNPPIDNARQICSDMEEYHAALAKSAASQTASKDLERLETYLKCYCLAQKIDFHSLGKEGSSGYQKMEHPALESVVQDKKNSGEPARIRDFAQPNVTRNLQRKQIIPKYSRAEKVLALAVGGMVALGIAAHYLPRFTTSTPTDLQAVVPKTSQSQENIKEYLYFVRPGESLVKISENISGDWNNWREIKKYNNLENVKLDVFQLLRIPARLAKNKNVLSAAQLVGFDVMPDKKKLPFRLYFCRDADTLEKISIAYSRAKSFADVLLAFNMMYNPKFSADLKPGYHVLIPPMVPRQIDHSQYKNFAIGIGITAGENSTLEDVSMYMSGTNIYANDIYAFNKVHNPGFSRDLKPGTRVEFLPCVPRWKPN